MDAFDKNQMRLIEALRDPSNYPHAADDPQVLETHISWVVLCGEYAYKIKKAVNLGFLDFSTLDLRRHYCQEELRLNRRLAPRLYLKVIPITGSFDAPRLQGGGDAIEYAVQMRRFPQQALLDRALIEHRLDSTHIDLIAETVAHFHSAIAVTETESTYGAPEQVRQPVDQNFVQIRERIREPDALAALTRVQAWSEAEYARRLDALTRRKKDGFIRECHGDMHLGNMAWFDDELIIFDGIEFNPALYWIDVMSEVAFLCMDLEDHGRRDFAYRFLNTYLHHTGDYAGLQVLPYYLSYRAMVRAKVASIRLQQAPRASASTRTEFDNYLELAIGYTRTPRPILLITHGLSGSGKSALSQPLAERLPAIRLRSDAERQRMFGRGGSGAGIGGGVYGPEAGTRTYERLEQLARTVLDAGHSVIVDAAFLDREQRARFIRLAEDLQVPMRILHFHASEATLRSRVTQRQSEGQDISEAGLRVLEHQLRTYQPLAAEEEKWTVDIDSESVLDASTIHSMVLKTI